MIFRCSSRDFSLIKGASGFARKCAIGTADVFETVGFCSNTPAAPFSHATQSWRDGLACADLDAAMSEVAIQRGLGDVELVADRLHAQLAFPVERLRGHGRGFRLFG